ncbi:MAG TPA: serine hydrolase [Chitinophagales bacterium]|nr:serine hydrolase [Chitinophagales bacterium]
MKARHLTFIGMIYFSLASCLKENELKKPFQTFVPQEIHDGWTLSSPSAEGVDSIQLADIYRDVHENEDLWQIRSLVVFRNGKLVAESYMKSDADRTKPVAIWSCTKQVMGVLTGIAIEKGLIGSVRDSVSKYLPDELQNHPDKKNITIEELLTMRSGIAYSNDGLKGHTDDLLRNLPDNSVEFILDLFMDAAPGTEFHYNDGNPHLLSAIFQKLTGKPTDVWADEVLFSKLNLTNYHWHRYRDGVTFGAFGILTTPREFAKVAQCVMNKGNFNGVQVADSAWISEMLYPLVTIPEQEDISFGYFWWIRPSRNIFYMNGHGGQFAFAIPSKNLLVAITAEPNTQDEFQISDDEALEIVDRIIKACN